MAGVKPEDLYLLDHRLSRRQKLRIFVRRNVRYYGATLAGMVAVLAIIGIVGGLYLGLPVLVARSLGYAPSGGLAIGTGPRASAGVTPRTAP